MKKLLALLLALTLMLSLAACGGDKDTASDGSTATPQTVGSDGTGTSDATPMPGETAEPSATPEPSQPTETSKPEETSKPTETSKPEETSKPIETSKPEETSEPTESSEPEETSKPAETSKPEETSKPVETPEPEHRHSYSGKITKNATCGESGVRTFTCSCGNYYTEKIPATGQHSWGVWVTVKEPTTDSEGTAQRKCQNCSATENKKLDKIVAVQKDNYFVGIEVVNIEHKTTFYDIDGMNFFDKLYGKNGGGQTGDIVTCKIKTSDGNPIDIRVDETHRWTYEPHNCTYEINGNTITLVLTDNRPWEHWADLWFYAKDENGNEKLYSTGKIPMYPSNENFVENCAIMDDIIEIYAQRLGMKRLWGQEARDAGITTSNYDDFDNIRIPNNPNWIREVFAVVDKYHQKDSTVICFMTIETDGWQGISDKWQSN